MALIAIAAFLVLSSCNGQTVKKEINDQAKADKPKTDVQVKKVYDDHGNLIKYDSTYTYVYTNPETKGSVRDSVMAEFSKHFGKNGFTGNESFFNNMFSNDSLIMNNDAFAKEFFNKDFMPNDFGLSSQNMEKFFQQMDSVRNEFFGHVLKPEINQKQ